MTDDQFFLANAYLDGVLAADEQATAEADPAVMVEVERLRALGIALRDVEPARHQVREQALASALGEFDRAYRRPPVAAPATSTAAPIPFRPRPAIGRWLAAAAAVLAIGVLGLAVVTAGGGGDDDEIASVATESPAVAEADDAARTLEANAPTASDLAATEAMDAAGEAEATAAIEAPAATEAPAGTEAATAAPAAIPFDANVPILDEAGLAAVGADLLAREAAGTLGITPETQCGAGGESATSVLAAGVYQLPTGDRPVWIAIDRIANTVQALDVDTCEPLATAPLP